MSDFTLIFLKDEDSEELEDMIINPTDGVIVCARNEDDVNQLEACCSYLRTFCFASSSSMVLTIFVLSTNRFGYVKSLMVS